MRILVAAVLLSSALPALAARHHYHKSSKNSGAVCAVSKIPRRAVLPRIEEACPDPEAALKQGWLRAPCTSGPFGRYIAQFAAEDEGWRTKVEQWRKDICEEKDEAGHPLVGGYEMKKDCEAGEDLPPWKRVSADLAVGWRPPRRSKVKTESPALLEAALRQYKDDRYAVMNDIEKNFGGAQLACRAYARSKNGGDQSRFNTAAAAFLAAYDGALNSPDLKNARVRLESYPYKAYLGIRKGDVKGWIKKFSLPEEEIQTLAASSREGSAAARARTGALGAQQQRVQGLDPNSAGVELTRAFDAAGYNREGAPRGVEVGGVQMEEGGMTADVSVDWSKINEAKKEELARRLGVGSPAGTSSVKVKVAGAISLAAGVAGMERQIKAGQTPFTLANAAQATIQGVQHPEEPPAALAGQAAQGVLGEAAEGHSQQEIQDKTNALKAKAAADYAVAMAKSAEDCDKAKQDFMGKLTFDQLHNPMIQSQADAVVAQCKDRVAQAGDKQRQDLALVAGREDAARQLEEMNRQERIATYRGLLQAKKDEVLADQDAAHVSGFRTLWQKKSKGRADEGLQVDKAEKAFKAASSFLIIQLNMDLQSLQQPESELYKQVSASDSLQRLFEAQYGGEAGIRTTRIKDYEQAKPQENSGTW